ncbi:MAG: hypothetical protein D4R82_04880 [Dehalococcoidia bacterium]|nr:MAG: hypothetical protein D4R82_04880 [Dehalococcoidia bacterium]
MLTIVATAASITPAISFWGSYFRKAGLLTLICWILFFLIVAQQVRSRQQLFRAIYALLLSSGIISVLGILQHFFPDILFSYTCTGRVFYTPGNALSFSIFFALVIPLNLALIVNSWNKWIHPHPLPSREREVSREGKNAGVLVGLIILLGLQFWCLWLAQYSITILLFIIAPIVFTALLGIVKRKRLLLGFGAMSLLILMVVASLILMPLLFPGTTDETLETEESEFAVSAEDVGLVTLDWRLQYWHSAIDIVLEPPEVPFHNDRLHSLRTFIGYGPETFIVTYQRFFPEEMENLHSLLSVPLTRPHNHYLYLAATIGLLGLASFLSILAVFFYLCFRYLRRSTADTYKLLLIALAASMVGYMADSLFNPSTISAEVVFWLILSLVPVIGRLATSDEPAKAASEETARHSNNEGPHITKARPYLAMVCAILLIAIGIGITIRPFLADMYFQKGLNLQTAKSEQAIFAFDKAVKIDPGEAAYWNGLGGYSYSVALHANEGPLKAEVLALSTDALEKARELEPYIAYRYYSLADIYTYWAKQGAVDKWPAALSLYDKASQLIPRNPIILNKWSLALIIKGDFNEARTKLDYAASIDPDWAETSFLSGLLLAREGKDDAAAHEIMSPIKERTSHLNYFTELCCCLAIYDMAYPLGDVLEAYAQKASGEWIPHAMLGVTSLFAGSPDESLDEFNTAMSLVPVEDVGDVFGVIVKFSKLSPYFRAQLPSVAPEWRGKLSQAEHSDALLRELDKLLDNPSQG